MMKQAAHRDAPAMVARENLVALDHCFHARLLRQERTECGQMSKTGFQRLVRQHVCVVLAHVLDGLGKLCQGIAHRRRKAAVIDP